MQYPARTPALHSKYISPPAIEHENLADALGYTDDQLDPIEIDPPSAPLRELKLPPYSRKLTLQRGDTAFIYTGPDAWERAKRKKLMR